MSETIKQEDLIEKKDETSSSTETEQDPLKTELERVQRTGKTEAEKAAFSLKKNAERAKELGIDVEDVLGIDKPSARIDVDLDEDDKPVTVGMLRKIQQDNASKNALQMADDISNESERELTKYHLQNSIRPTGNPAEDLRLARALTNSAKNTQILEEAGRKAEPKTHSTASSGNAKNTEVQSELTPAEKQFLGKPFNMTVQDILKARKK